jgi:hypothetical protein
MSASEDPTAERERPPALPGDDQEPLPDTPDEPKSAPLHEDLRGTIHGPPDETYPWADVAARLRAKADRGFPEAWMPQAPGDELVGVVQAIKPTVRTSYGPVPVLEIEQPGPNGKTWSVWLLHTVLRREVWRQEPAIGETIYIRYDGRVKPEAGTSAYESYTVLVDRPDQNTEINWRELAEQYDPGVLEPQGLTPGPGHDYPPADEADDIPF